MASLLLTEVISKLQSVYKEEHDKLGQMLTDKSVEGKESSNWQGGKVNGIGSALDIVREMAKEY